MTVVLRPITKDNWEAAAGLRVREDQADFVAPNAWSIAESKFYDALQPMAIYDDETMIGFLMYGLDPEDGQYWLYRLMIDQRYQRRGLGRAALARLIDLLRRTPGCGGVNVGYDPANTGAEQLYLSLGFVKTGLAPWGELTARLTFADA
ncbi:MAG: diamine N-acetyltransferase [Thermomicrobiales bacterium]|jgi:diamine N-acetyltransferase|nr:diamine N-acetyltransferase [Thermomicrobiales bacterium]MEA2524988.1 diamine N-acetyltransferase [Thermomicrobiales bacterium]MEA2531342.1 diamine N-acetyltransferase [Thermomicrobiales bacterium]MEA2595719.1 diamine N-acetyltransferase [Thermomicrobiales bacterium]